MRQALGPGAGRFFTSGATGELMQRAVHRETPLLARPACTAEAPPPGTALRLRPGEKTGKCRISSRYTRWSPDLQSL